MVGAGELDDDLAPGDGAGEADGAHRRLGAGAGHPQHLDRGDAGDDLLGQLDLGGGRGAEAGPRARRPRLTAATTAGWAWPRISGPQEQTQST